MAHKEDVCQSTTHSSGDASVEPLRSSHLPQGERTPDGLVAAWARKDMPRRGSSSRSEKVSRAYIHPGR